MNKNIRSQETDKIDILFINPSMDLERDRDAIAKRRIEKNVGNQETPHIGIGYLIAVAKANGLKAKYIDMPGCLLGVEQVLRFIEKTKPSLIGLTSYSVQISSAGYVASRIKQNFPDALICVGGSHATTLPLETLAAHESFDFVVCGEGEEILPQLMERIRLNKDYFDIQGVVVRGKKDTSYKLIDSFGELPFPAWEEFDLSRYGGVFPHRKTRELPITTSRGCPFSCIFCVRPFGQKRRLRPVASVINEIKRNIEEFECDSIAFIDETFIFDLKWSNELFRMMIRQGLNKKINWSCETRVDTVSPELFKLMKEAGCYYVYFGFESGDDAILKNIKKNVKVEEVKQAISWAKDADLICAGSFIIGLPGETRETAAKSIQLAKELNIYSTTFPIAVPFPGTVLRQMAKRNEFGLRILTDNWDDYGKQYPGVMESDKLSRQDLRDLQKLAYDTIPKKALPALTE